MEEQELKKYAGRIFTAARNKGFQPGDVSIYHMLALIVAEVGEVIDADRNGRRANVESFENVIAGIDWGKDGAQRTWVWSFKHAIKDSIEDEMADVVILLLELAQRIGHDFDRPFVARYRRNFTDFDTCENAFALMKGIVNPGIALQHRVRWAIEFVFAWHDSLPNKRGTDLRWYIDRKIEYNATRPPKNGKRY